MKIRALFSSRQFYIFNLALVSMVIGAFITMVAFSCATPMRPAKAVFAQDREPLAIQDSTGAPASFRHVANYVLPSVVEVRVVSSAGNNGGNGAHPFDFRFGPGDNESPPPGSPGLGSGVVVSRSAKTLYVATNEHVAGNAAEITVVTDNGDEYPGILVGTDPRRDLAIISFEPDSVDAIPVAPFGDSDDLFVGDWVLAIGNPFGFASTVTAGIISAKGRSGPIGNISDFIQTDAAINQGNSGGPLVNMSGEVVGINTWITTPTGMNVGLGFAIPINNVKKAIADIIENGAVEYGWLGVEVEDVTQLIAEQLEYHEKRGAIIAQIFDGSPAEEGGIRPGDIAVSLDGIAIRDYLHLVRIVGDKPPGDSSIFTLYRDGETIETTVVIGRRSSDSAIQRANRTMWPGMSVAPLTDDLRTSLGIEGGIDGIFVSEVKQAAAPQSVGIRRGDIIININGSRVKNLLDFYRIVNDTENRVFDLELLRRGETLAFAIRRE